MEKLPRWIFCFGIIFFWGTFIFGAEQLDRREIVARHAIDSDSTEMTVPLANGEFCFNADGTGLQTVAGSTLHHRGWFSSALPEGVTSSDIPSTGTFQQGRNRGPDNFPADKQALRTWLFDNPHRMNLARIRLTRADGSAPKVEEIRSLHRRLDLWTGLHQSEFMIDGDSFVVETAVGDNDSVAFRVTSPGVAAGRFCVTIDFPLPTFQDGPWVGDFDADSFHRTENANQSDHGVTLFRRFGKSAFGDYDYAVRIDGQDGTALIHADGENRVRLQADHEGAGRLEAVVSFGCLSPTGNRSEDQENSFRKFADENKDGHLYETAVAESVKRWEEYWLSGGAIDLSGSRDPRWKELERRIVLSQYLMKTSASGSYPPPEVGLLGIDFWRGQFHMEMAWWHLAHWFLWERENLADRPLTCYENFKEPAAELARQLGYKGYQWQKSIGPEARTAPWIGNQVLLWKEPHPIFFAELDYRARPTDATLEKWADVIDGTATFMADYVTIDQDGVGHLAPVMPPSELGITQDATFDLAYWRRGLEWANQWRTRRGLTPDAEWDAAQKSLAPLAVGADGLYVRSVEWTEWRKWEHPDLIGAFGYFPPVEGMEADRAKRTVEAVVERWEWEKCWGWDFPWTAMAAARTGRPDLAVEMLLNPSPRNDYDGRGVNQGGPCPYLPGNGGLLYAVAMMAAGWDGGPDEVLPGPETENQVHETAPGFPDNGMWRVRWENLRPAP